MERAKIKASNFFLVTLLFKGDKYMLTGRQGVFVWLYTLKQAKQLRRYGNVLYISKKLKYVHLYCNMDETEGIVEKLQKLSYVKRVDLSYRPFLKTEFENSRPDKAKEYDYKMGL